MHLASLLCHFAVIQIPHALSGFKKFSDFLRTKFSKKALKKVFSDNLLNSFISSKIFILSRKSCFQSAMTIKSTSEASLKSPVAKEPNSIIFFGFSSRATLSTYLTMASDIS
jgi:hypothetical protein